MCQELANCVTFVTLLRWKTSFCCIMEGSHGLQFSCDRVTIHESEKSTNAKYVTTGNHAININYYAIFSRSCSSALIITILDLGHLFHSGVFVVVIVWSLHFQLPVQSVHINTKAVSSNPAHGEVNSKQHYMIKFALLFPPQIKLTATI